MTEVLSFPGLGLEFNLNRVAFSIGNISVYWYGIIIALGVALAITYVMLRARKCGVHPDRLIDVLMGGFVGGILGARIYYVVFQWSYYKDNLSEIYKIWNGGLGIYGGIIGAILAGWLMCKWRKVKFLPVLDLAGMGFLIGQCIGRWGNFVNVEAFGCNTTLPWGMESQSIANYMVSNYERLHAQGMDIVLNMPVHPCFLYESLWCLVGFIALNFYFKHRKFDGEIFLMYTAWYGFGRFFIEGLRTDSLMIGTIRVSQVLAILLVFAAMIAIIVIRCKIASEHDPEYLKLYGETDDAKEMLARIDEQLKSKKKKTKDAEEAAEVEAIEAEDEAVLAEEAEKVEENITEEAKDEQEDK